MEATYVNVADLKFGKVVAEDIFANTKYPIVTKNTKVTPEHIDVFRAFQIGRVLVFADQIIEEGDVEFEYVVDVPVAPTTSFEKHYNHAINFLKKEFLNWGAGAKVDITKVRGAIIPLIEQVLENRSFLFDLNSYSNPNDYIYHHCIATGLIAGALSQKLGYDRGVCIQMSLAGVLADCGMAKIPTKIRDKKTTLTEVEFLEIRKHPIYSYQMVKDLPALKTNMKQSIFQHHERLDGSGYPRGIKSEEISIYSQIIAVADVFHAMTSERLYRSKQSPFKVIDMIKESEFGKFDIKVVQALIDTVADLPIGTRVKLSNYEQAEVMFINRYAPTRPIVKLIITGEIIDLSSYRNFHILRVVTKD